MTKEERAVIYTYGAEELRAAIAEGPLALPGDPMLGRAILDRLAQAADIKPIIEKQAAGHDVCALQFLLEDQDRINAPRFIDIVGRWRDALEIAAVSSPRLPETPRVFLKKTPLSTGESNRSGYFLEITAARNLLVCPGCLENVLIAEFTERSVVLALSPRLGKAIVVMHNRADLMDLGCQSVPLYVDTRGLKALISNRVQDRSTALVHSEGEHLLDLDVSDILLVNTGARFTIMEVLRRLAAYPRGGE